MFWVPLSCYGVGNKEQWGQNMAWAIPWSFRRKRSVGFEKEDWAHTFRSCQRCWGMIRRAVDVSSEGKEALYLFGNENIIPAWRGMVWDQQWGALGLVQNEAGAGGIATREGPRARLCIKEALLEVGGLQGLHLDALKWASWSLAAAATDGMVGNNSLWLII